MTFEGILWISEHNPNKLNGLEWIGNMEIQQNTPFPLEEQQTATDGFLWNHFNKGTDLFHILSDYESKDGMPLICDIGFKSNGFN